MFVKSCQIQNFLDAFTAWMTYIVPFNLMKPYIFPGDSTKWLIIYSLWQVNRSPDKKDFVYFATVMYGVTLPTLFSSYFWTHCCLDIFRLSCICFQFPISDVLGHFATAFCQKPKDIQNCNFLCLNTLGNYGSFK